MEWVHCKKRNLMKKVNREGGEGKMEDGKDFHALFDG